MTTEKMPDVIWAYYYKRRNGMRNNGWFFKEDLEASDTKYYRAEPVEAREKAANDLLETARDFMSRVARGDYDTGTLLPLILMIDKFLGGKE